MYFLPHSRKSQNCEVTISLPYGYNSDTSSWDELKIEANYLAEKCCDPPFSDDLSLNANSPSALGGKNNKGAYTPAGLHGRMRIDLTYSASTSEAPITLSIGGNATDSTSNAVLGGTTAISKAANTTDLTSDTVAAA